MISTDLPLSGGGSLERWETLSGSIQCYSRSADPIRLMENMATTTIRNIDNIFIKGFPGANQQLFIIRYKIPDSS
jgi:uncharacterized protein (UPF0333 family)